jgi:hypothetical protein
MPVGATSLAAPSSESEAPPSALFIAAAADRERLVDESPLFKALDAEAAHHAAVEARQEVEAKPAVSIIDTDARRHWPRRIPSSKPRREYVGRWRCINDRCVAFVPVSSPL